MDWGGSGGDGVTGSNAAANETAVDADGNIACSMDGVAREVALEVAAAIAGALATVAEDLGIEDVGIVAGALGAVVAGLYGFNKAYDYSLNSPQAAALVGSVAYEGGLINILGGGLGTLNGLGISINPTTGAITNSSGAVIGAVDPAYAGGGFSIGPIGYQGLDLSEDQFGVGPVALDMGPGPGFQQPPESFGVYANDATMVGADLVAQINGIGNPSEPGYVQINRPGTRAWLPGICSSIGVPIVSYKQWRNLASAQNAFLSPNCVAGKDGIYSLRTGRRLVPPANVGAAPLGFSIGQYADYQQVDLLMAWTAGGRAILLGANDVVNVLDSTTGQLLNLVCAVVVKVFNGSQQINVTGAPADWNLNYPGPNPNAASPGYNTKAPGFLGGSGCIGNGAVMTNTQAAQPNGPEGGANR